MRLFHALVLIPMAAAAAALGCSDDPDEYFITGTSCVPGQQIACACPNGGDGAQVCTSQGDRYSPCDCSEAQPPSSAGGSANPQGGSSNQGGSGNPQGGSGNQGGSSQGGNGQGGSGPVGSCTLFPDCGGCQGCFDTCICQSEGDVDGCEATCLSGSGGSGSGGSSGGTQCVESACPDPGINVGGIAAKCCTADETCGLSISLLGPDCIEGDQAGTPDASCPSQSLGGFTLQGCCKPDGICGVNDTFLGLGCFDITQVLGGAPQSC